MRPRNRFFAALRRLFVGRPTPAQLVPPTNLGTYRALIAELPKPSVKQMEQFAEFIGEAHSWYKHLPLLPPGRPVNVFLDPAAGLQLETDGSGRVEANHRSKPGFHYSWLATDEYRARFGHLAFSQSDGTLVALRDAKGIFEFASDDAPQFFDRNRGKLCQLPKEVQAAGQAHISGVLHTLGAHAHPLLSQMSAGYEWHLPSDELAEITDRCQELVRDPSRMQTLEPGDPRLQKNRHLLSTDVRLYGLLEKERARQRAGLVEAMRRVVALSYANEV